jgi:hypothetical protein
MDLLDEMKAIVLPNKLFAVFTAPDGNLYYRKMWSMRLVGYLDGIGAMKNKGWENFIKNAEVGQVFNVPLDDYYAWMTLVRISDEEDKDDTV